MPERTATRMPEPHPTLLLIGPTGSGKTPLGEYLERHGLWGRSCRHFDFGARLRGVAAGRSGVDLTGPERQVVLACLHSGALLEEEHFPIARKIVERFLQDRADRPGDLVVLNGLPRHRGQAAALEPILQTVKVISLECTPETVVERLRRDPAGDREGRTDDTLEAVAGRLRIYRERTRPLLDWYRERGVPIIKLEVGPDTRPDDLYPLLSTLPAPRPGA
jgi:adenylate kinase